MANDIFGFNIEADDLKKVAVTFLKYKQNNTRDAEIEMFMVWFSNQRIPEVE
jgi:hypothetical protein